MAQQTDLDKIFIEMAYSFAKLSNAVRRKVGCIIVKDGQVISNGFNGTPSGFDNTCETVSDKLGIPSLHTKPEVLHAESNALMKIARSTNSSIGSTMYLTCSPCFECAKLIIQSGIIRLVYNKDYRTQEGIDLLRQTDIIIEKI
jgi:dCMP deaminase